MNIDYYKQCLARIHKSTDESLNVLYILGNFPTLQSSKVFLYLYAILQASYLLNHYSRGPRTS